MTVRKKFDKKLYSNNDPAKLMAISYFERRNRTAIVNPDDYGIDLIVDGKFYCEVEVKHNWKGSKFPFNTVQIPERKSKFTVLDKPVMFMIINSEHTHALLMKGTDVSESPLKEVKNKFVSDGEMFYQVPIDKTIKVLL